MLPSCKTLESWEILGKKFVLSHIFFPPKHYPAHQERQPGPTLLRRQFYEATFLNAHSGGTVFCGLGTVLRWELHRNCVKFPHMNKYNLSSLQGSLAFFFLGEICGFLRSHRFTISSGKFPSDFLIEKSSEFWTWFFPATKIFFAIFLWGGGATKKHIFRHQHVPKIASWSPQNYFLKKIAAGCPKSNLFLFIHLRVHLPFFCIVFFLIVLFLGSMFRPLWCVLSLLCPPPTDGVWHLPTPVWAASAGVPPGARALAAAERSAAWECVSIVSWKKPGAFGREMERYEQWKVWVQHNFLRFAAVFFFKFCFALRFVVPPSKKKNTNVYFGFSIQSRLKDVFATITPR